jgi:hypothetical protein
MRIVNLVVEHEQVQYRAIAISSNRYERKYTRRATIQVILNAVDIIDAVVVPRIGRNVQLRIVNERTIVNHSSHDGAQTRIDHSHNAMNNEAKRLIDEFKCTF